MTRKVLTLGLAIGLTALATGLTLHGQIKKGKERPLLTKQLMKGLVQPNCAALKKDLEAPPANDDAWAAAATKAALLNEASYILMADGRCPDADWAGAAKTLREESANLLEAIDKKDADSAKATFGAMTKACATCHKAHKK